MEKSSKIHITPGAMVLFSEGVLPSGVQKTYGIKTYGDLKAVIDSGEYIVENPTPLQAELDLEQRSL